MIKKILNIISLPDRGKTLPTYSISRAIIVYQTDNIIFGYGYSDSSGKRCAVLEQSAFYTNSTPGLNFLKALVNDKTLEKNLLFNCLPNVFQVRNMGGLILLQTIRFFLKIITQIINHHYAKLITLFLPIIGSQQNRIFNISANFQNKQNINRHFKSLMKTIKMNYIFRINKNEGDSGKSFKFSEFSSCKYFNELINSSYSRFNRCQLITIDV